MWQHRKSAWSLGYISVTLHYIRQLALAKQSVEEQEVTRYWNHRVPRDWYSKSVTEWLSRDQITGTAVTLDQWKRHEYSTVRRSWGHEMNSQVHQCGLGTPVQVTYVATGWASIAGQNIQYHEIKIQDSVLLGDDVASMCSRIPTLRYITVSVLIFKGNYYSYQKYLSDAQWHVSTIQTNLGKNV